MSKTKQKDGEGEFDKVLEESLIGAGEQAVDGVRENKPYFYGLFMMKPLRVYRQHVKKAEQRGYGRASNLYATGKLEKEAYEKGYQDSAKRHRLREKELEKMAYNKGYGKGYEQAIKDGNK